jgi:glutamate synthase domain-containing protein 2
VKNQVNQNMVQQQEEHLASIQRLRDQLDTAQSQAEALRWELVAARGESEALSALVQGAEECIKLMREKGQGKGNTGEGGEHRDDEDGDDDDGVAVATRAVDDWLESMSLRGGKWAEVSEVCNLKAEISELR